MSILTLNLIMIKLLLIAPTCQKQTYRGYYQENGCRSLKKYKLAKCGGSCGDHCCKPLKSKKRSLKMICADRTSYHTNIEIIKKCGCAKKC
jgi:protein slit